MSGHRASDDDRPAHRALRLRGSIDGVERRLSLHPGRWSVGSRGDCDFVVPQAGVSRLHARLEVDADDGVRIVDEGSRNGTRVDGVRIEEGRLEPGQVLAIGPVELVLEAVDRREIEIAIGGIARPPGLDTPDEPATPDAVEPSTHDMGPTRGYRALAAALAELRHGTTGRAATAFARELGATRLRLTEARDGRPPMVLASRGADAIDARATNEEIVVVRLEHDGTAYELALGPPSLGRRHLEPVLQLFLELVAWGHDRSRRGPAAAASAVDDRERARRDETPDAAVDSGAGAGDDGAGVLRLGSGIVRGASPAMRRVERDLAAIALSDVPVLLVGETGVGKEHLARAVHATSPRAGGPYVALNCAAIPAEQVEAELFGVRRGVATGVEARAGRFLEADGGTIFLDEIGDLPEETQVKLLRVLEGGAVRPLGGTPRPVDVRVVAATNARLAERMADGRFRPDLYYRLGGHVQSVPPLRTRREDVPILVEHFFRQSLADARRAGRSVAGLSTAALERLTGHDWPGNVRELAHEVRRLVWSHDEPGGVIDSAAVLPEIERAPTVSRLDLATVEDLDLRRHVAELERDLIGEALRRTDGSRRRASALLGLSRNGLAAKMKRLGLGD